jgi:hypothetical protein
MVAHSRLQQPDGLCIACLPRLGLRSYTVCMDVCALGRWLSDLLTFLCGPYGLRFVFHWRLILITKNITKKSLQLLIAECRSLFTRCYFFQQADGQSIA